MQTRFVAPRTAEPCLSGATPLSAVGMTNSALAGGRGQDHGWPLQHRRSRTPGCCVWLPSCQARSHPRGAVGAHGAWLLVRSNSQLGPRWNELTSVPLGLRQWQVWARHSCWMSTRTVTVTFRPWASTVRHLRPTYDL